MTIEEAIGNVMCGKCIPHKKETKNKINEILQENAELKRLLKLAVEDLEHIEKNIGPTLCDGNGCTDCPYCEVYDNESFIYCKWKHADEAMKLIGGNEND